MTRWGVGVALAGAMFVAGASPVLAAPSPNAGPSGGGTAVSDLLPTTVFSDIAAGEHYSLVLDSEGFAYGFGYNYFGTLGNGAADSPAQDNATPLPVIMPEGVRFSSITAGFDHAGALTESGDVYTWGDNREGQLGAGDGPSSYVPIRISTPVPMREIAAAWQRTWAVGTDGKLYAWGRNTEGTLGDGTSERRTTAVQLPTPEGVTFHNLSAQNEHAVALGSDNRTYVWGRNFYAQLGLGVTTPVVTTPQPLTHGDSPYVSIAAGKTQTVATASDGKSYAWGENTYGQLGNGATGGIVAAPTEVNQNGAPPFTSVTAGWDYSAGIGTDGQVYAWGGNPDGQLGLGSTEDHPVPQLVTFPEPVVVKKMVAGAQRHSLALTSKGDVYAWGRNEAGAVGIGSAYTAWSPLKLSGTSTITEVLFGDLAGTHLEQHGNTWTADTPGGCGAVDVTVRFSQFGRDRERVFPGGFTYGTAPTITEHPASATLARGATFTAEVSYSGDPAPTLSWQHSADGETNWEDLPGQSEKLSVTAKNDGFYRAVATSCAGSATSEVAKLTLKEEKPKPKPKPNPSLPADKPDQGGPLAPKLPPTGGQGLQLLIPAAAVTVLAGAVAVTAARRSRR